MRGELLPRNDQRQLTRYRHGPGGAIGLGRPPIAVPVDLPREGDVGVVEVFEVYVRPREPAELRHAGAGERGDGEQRAVGLGGGGERLLDLFRVKMGRRVASETFGRSEDSINAIGFTSRRFR